tara:strand:- start:1139 stop:1789 length:651 start_codon:yes stop_codon:yes gene_type:complete
MVCSFCKQVGHNYKTCPTISEEEKEKKMKENYEKKKKMKEKSEKKKKMKEKTQYLIVNNSNTELVVYYGWINSRYINRYRYLSVGESINISCIKMIHTIVILPFIEICNGNPNAPHELQMIDCESYSMMFNEKLKNYDGDTILINKKYDPPKTELEKWRECALKSKYLLDELIKMGGMKYDNLEPILDMVQDINVPNYDEIDKERAGVPSILTNIT